MTDLHCDSDRRAAAWTNQLMDDRLIAAGTVTTTPVGALGADEVRGHARVHLFSGIAGWARALDLIGWPSQSPAWTASCPCQPFSSMGLQRGTDDPRHVWPDAAALISACRPPVVFGEQVGDTAGRQWLAQVRSDCEGLGYDFAAAEIPAAAVGAPHIRHRLYWAAALPDWRPPRLGEPQPGPWGVEPATMADGTVRRVPHGMPLVEPRSGTTAMIHRGVGNAIVPRLAAHFIVAASLAVSGLCSGTYQDRLTAVLAARLPLGDYPETAMRWRGGDDYGDGAPKLYAAPANPAGNWDTPTALNERGRRHTHWATPDANNRRNRDPQRVVSLPHGLLMQSHAAHGMRLDHVGRPGTGYGSTGTRFTAWLMDFPPAWVDAAVASRTNYR